MMENDTCPHGAAPDQCPVLGCAHHPAPRPGEFRAYEALPAPEARFVVAIPNPVAHLTKSQETIQAAAQALHRHAQETLGPLPEDEVRVLAALDALTPTMSVDALWKVVQRLACEVLELREQVRGLLCGAETTLRSDEHRLAQCREPRGHSGVHRDPRGTAPVEWTDASTVFEAPR